MRWLVVDARKRHVTLLVAALAAALLLGWTAWSGVRGRRVGALRPITHGDAAGHQVALTFDVDRGTSQVRAILRELAAAEAPATFFVTERWVKEHPETAQAMIADGHSVEASGRDYSDMSGLRRDQAASELRGVVAAIGKAVAARPSYFRPPAGRCSDALLDAAIAEGLIPVTWSVDSADWRLSTASAIAQRVVSAARPGAIVLLHAGDGNSLTAAALGELVAGLRRNGLAPVRLSVLLATEGGD
ncbi:MAG: polysaccharide deacetylase family protein [Chloroflexota bacterium]